MNTRNEKIDQLSGADLETPAFVYDEQVILERLKILHEACAQCGCTVLFPIKSFCVADPLRFIARHVDGFAASSTFEAKLSRQILGDTKCIHFTSPGIRHDAIRPLSEICDYISFNSLFQWNAGLSEVNPRASCGIRINPQLPFVRDERYNPCRRNSKLGVPLGNFVRFSEYDWGRLRGLRGILIHSNCESNDSEELFQTVRHLDLLLPRIFEQVSWVNLGGGYVFESELDLLGLRNSVRLLKDKYGLDVFFEPGKGVIGVAGSIVTSVLDLFESDGQMIAVLDTAINHMPEVFEYQYKPDIAQESEDGKHSYILAGATCLAGDIFGEYRFDEPLEIGSRVVFEDMGAYTLVKANMFNGINLPTIYAYTLDGNLEMKRQFTYEDFLSRCGANGNDPL